TSAPRGRVRRLRRRPAVPKPMAWICAWQSLFHPRSSPVTEPEKTLRPPSGNDLEGGASLLSGSPMRAPARRQRRPQRRKAPARTEPRVPLKRDRPYTRFEFLTIVLVQSHRVTCTNRELVFDTYGSPGEPARHKRSLNRAHHAGVVRAERLA